MKVMESIGIEPILFACKAKDLPINLWSHSPLYKNIRVGGKYCTVYEIIN